MKVFKSIISFFMILIIIGGIGFIGWNFIKSQKNMAGMNTPNTTKDATKSPATEPKSSDSSMSSMPNTQINPSLNTQTIQNKDRLNQVVTMINDAVNQITIDPYSKVTVPGTVIQPNTPVAQPGNTTVNIYPNSSSAVNIPSQTAVIPPAVASTINPSANIVYNQEKLDQLHNGIFKLAQGMMLLNDLNDDLTLQATATEPNSYDGYVAKYATLLQNKLKLSKSLIMINEASTLININPYTSGIGYQYNMQQMEQFHKGVYKLAQGLLQGIKLGDDFTNQMAQINSLSNNNSMNKMNMTSNSSFPKLNIQTIATIIIIVLILTFIISLLGAVKSTFTRVDNTKK